MREHLKELLKYCYHVNLQYIEFLEENDMGEKANQLMSHIVTAHHHWNCRILKEKPAFEVWDSELDTSLFEIDKGNYISSIAILDKYSFDKEIEYTNSKGLNYLNTIKDIFTHVVNHSSYHRGQISNIIVKSGSNPPVTDYIAYIRTPK